MAASRRKNGLQGVTRFRQKLRRFGEEATREVREELKRSLHDIERDALGGVPVDQGDLARSIEVKISRDGFSGIVGPGAGAAEIVRRAGGSAFSRYHKRGRRAGQKINLNTRNRHALMQFYKGYWIEFGTKGNKDLNLPAQPARPFMSPAYEVNKERMRARLNQAIRRMLERVARGG